MRSFDVSRALIAEFLRASEKSILPIICVGITLVITNHQARMSLTADELRECEELALRDRLLRHDRSKITLKTGTVLHTTIFGVFASRKFAGMILTIHRLEKEGIGIDFGVQAQPSVSMHYKSEFPIRSLEYLESSEISRALVAHKGNRVKVAESLGISRSSLYRKLKAYGLEAV